MKISTVTLKLNCSTDPNPTQQVWMVHG